jgi:hypothetical protein
MKTNKDRSPYLAHRLLGQVLVESGQRRQDNEATREGMRLFKEADEAESRAQEAKKQ